MSMVNILTVAISAICVVTACLFARKSSLVSLILFGASVFILPVSTILELVSLHVRGGAAFAIVFVLVCVIMNRIRAVYDIMHPEEEAEVQSNTKR